MNLDSNFPEKTHLQAFIEEIKTKFTVSNEEILDFFQDSSEKLEIIKEEINMRKEEDESYISWGGVSSTPGFNEILGMKKRSVVEECKSAELNMKKSSENFSFLNKI